MARGSGVPSTSASTLSAKQSVRKTPVLNKKVSAADSKSAKQDKASCKCVECDKSIEKRTHALMCEKCECKWKCADCLGLSDILYAELIENNSLHWFCPPCEETIFQQDTMDLKMEQFQSDICEKMEQMSRELQELRGIVSTEFRKPDIRDSIVAVEETVSKLVETVEKQRMDNHELRDSVQDAVREKLHEDKEEEDDIKRRSTNVIIHGLKEVQLDDREERNKGEEDQMQHMLHEIGCDDISVQSMVRLGKYETASTQETFRPVKVVLASEKQRDKVLSQAKNLYGSAVFKKVYIQQDLTVKQRQKRRELVQQLKFRKAQGEVNLIIVRDKIVVKRQRQQQEQAEQQ